MIYDHRNNFYFSRDPEPLMAMLDKTQLDISKLRV